MFISISQTHDRELLKHDKSDRVSFQILTHSRRPKINSYSTNNVKEWQILSPLWKAADLSLSSGMKGIFKLNRYYYVSYRI